MVPWNQLIQEGSPTFEVSGWVGIIATKTGKNANSLSGATFSSPSGTSLDLRRQRKRHFENQSPFLNFVKFIPLRRKMSNVRKFPWG